MRQTACVDCDYTRVHTHTHIIAYNKNPDNDNNNNTAPYLHAVVLSRL
jgi:hypothetical protein